MRALVTGAAGFIGSNLVDTLLDDGWQVRGVDSYAPYYPRSVKESNLSGAVAHPAFEIIEADLATSPLVEIVQGMDVVFHTAAQAGVRDSWARFDAYVACNVLATQRLLEACRETDVKRVVYSSSSSIYGNTRDVPTHESVKPRPHSPYGVTKLAGEHLCRTYAENWGLPTVSLRYFTVFGPRQRPDMATHRLIECGLSGGRFSLFGSGEQVRDFTLVSDVVAANLAAVHADLKPGAILNIAGGTSVSMNGLISELSELMDREIAIDRAPFKAGDVGRTGGCIEKARQLMGWEPRTTRREGLAQQIEWHVGQRERVVASSA